MFGKKNLVFVTEVGLINVDSDSVIEEFSFFGRVQPFTLTILPASCSSMALTSLASPMNSSRLDS